MIEDETLSLQIKILDDGFIKARRKDGRRLSEADKSEVRKWADSLPGTIAEDILKIFPGARILREARPCKYCSAMTKRDLPEKYRRGKVIERIEPNGKRVLPCHYCGRRQKG